jgi:transcriptional regulator with XRE-family HTH domain
MCLSKKTRDAIKAALDRKGITQADLAAQLNVTEQYVSGILSGRDSLSMKKADELVNAIGCRIEIAIEDRCE